ncbi:hypothetical protein NQZ68_020115 [Dissostichus eleginoides]|nr:hypothetical protein NQZ68_020115 [Dissostichus eleginoides]
MGYKPRNQTQKRNPGEKGKLSRKNKEVEIAHVKGSWVALEDKRWQGAGALPLPLYSLSDAPLSLIYNT